MAMSEPQTCFQCGHVLTEDVLHPGDAAPHVCRPPVGDALRTTSIEAATRAIDPVARDAEASYPLTDAELAEWVRVAAVAAAEAVLGVAMPSTRRDALDEAIAAVERLLRHKVPGAAGRYGGEDLWLVSYDEALARLRGLRDTQAPT